MLKKTVEKAINDQLNLELASAHAYMAMAADFSAKSLNGMSSWMWIQAQEEIGHMKKFLDYLDARGAKAVFGAMKAPKATWKTPLAAFQDALKHEQKVTISIHKIVDLATREKDHATSQFLQWFVAEQVEEEASAGEIVQKLEMIGDSPSGLLYMDKALGKRGVQAGGE